jgi:hypothetical protein
LLDLQEAREHPRIVAQGLLSGVQLVIQSDEPVDFRNDLSLLI